MRAEQAVRLTRDMGISHADFFRTLPAALGHRPYESRGGEVRLAEEGRELVIRIAPEGRRRLGALILPTTRVELCFRGYEPAQVSEFLHHFDSRFQRGGG